MDSQCEAVHPQTQGVRSIGRHRCLLVCSTHSRRDAIFWHVYVDVLWWHFERRGIFRSDFCGDNYRGLRLPEGGENLKESVTFVRVNSTKPTECLVNAADKWSNGTSHVRTLRRVNWGQAQSMKDRLGEPL